MISGFSKKVFTASKYLTIALTPSWYAGVMAGLVKGTESLVFCRRWMRQQAPDVEDINLFRDPVFVLPTLDCSIKPGDIFFLINSTTPTMSFKPFAYLGGLYFLKYKVVGAVNNFFQVALKVQ